MKKSKKLMILGLSAATAAVAATSAVSSFAWFASNYSVKTESMVIKASSNNVFLQIKNSTASWDDTNSFISAAAVTGTTANDAAAVVPTAAVNKVEADALTAYTGGVVAWANTSSTSVDSAAKGEGRSYTDVSSVANPTEANKATTYTLKNTFNLRLRPVYSTGTTLATTQPTAKDLVASVDWVTKPTSFDDDKIANAVSVLVYTGSVGQLFVVDSTSHDFVATTATTNIKLADTMTAGGTDVTCSIFVFIDGENENCKTSNVKLDNTYSVKVNFQVSDVTAGA